MDDARSWQNLRDRFLDAVRQPNPQSREIWRLIVGHPWYTETLHHAAVRVLRLGGLRREWLVDVMHEAIGLLAHDLELHVDLRADDAQSQESFDGWLATIIFRQCVRGSLRLRSLHPRFEPLANVDVATEWWPTLELQLEVQEALARINEPHRTVLILYGQHHSVRAVARHASMSRRAAAHALEHALHLLDELLGPAF